MEKEEYIDLFNEYISLYKNFLELNMFDTALYYLELIKTEIQDMSIKRNLKYYQKQLNEARFKNKQSTIHKYIVEKNVQQGKDLISKGNFENAIELYKATYNYTYDPIFNYYIGKCYYKLKRYKKAAFYVNKYNELGFEKLNKSMFYKSLIQYKKGNYIMARDTLIACQKVNDIKGDSFSLQRRLDMVNEKLHPVIELDINNLKEMIKNGNINDVIKYLKQDFISEEKLVKLKTELIELLFKTGYSFIAKNYLNEVSKTNDKEIKLKIDNINKMKKLWIKK